LLLGARPTLGQYWLLPSLLQTSRTQQAPSLPSLLLGACRSRLLLLLLLVLLLPAQELVQQPCLLGREKQACWRHPCQQYQHKLLLLLQVAQQVVARPQPAPAAALGYRPLLLPRPQRPLPPLLQPSARSAACACSARLLLRPQKQRSSREG
jgi:hypothetical protein